MRRYLFAVLSVLVAAGAAAAEGLVVSGAWIRQLPAGAPSGGYFSLHNMGAKPVVLVGASSPDYGMVMLHRTVEEGGVSKMVGVDRIEVPAGGELSFRPGGYHLMMMRPGHAIAPGSKVPVTLRFADGRRQTVHFEVRGPTGQ